MGGVRGMLPPSTLPGESSIPDSESCHGGTVWCSGNEGGHGASVLAGGEVRVVAAMVEGWGG